MDGLDYYDQEELCQAIMLSCDVCPECTGFGEVPEILIEGNWRRNATEVCLTCDGSGKHPDNHKEEVK